ncbi:MAG: NHLP family bacteriocin export ABC transporter peptidase/permease/ATPase subunit [Wenzhouxiangellaceae bacterium]
MTELSQRDLFDRFPALAKLRRRRRIPLRAQTALTDCGAACLCMLLAYHGKDLPLDDVRTAVGVGRDGADAINILKAARWYGFVGRGVKVSRIEDIQQLPTGAILHWGFRHYLIYEFYSNGRYHLIDPGQGRLSVSPEEMSKYFTGVALVLEPGDYFSPQRRQATGMRRYLNYLLTQRDVLIKIVVTSVILQLLALAVPLLTGMLVDQIVPREDVALLNMLVYGLAIIVLFRLLSALLRSHLLIYLRTRLDVQSSFNFLHHLMDLPYAFFQQRSAGDLITRLRSNADIRDILTAGTLSALLDGTTVALYLLALLFVSSTLGWLTIGLGALRVGIFLFTRRRYGDLMSEYLQAQAATNGYQVNMLGGIETLKASGAEERALAMWSQYFVSEVDVTVKQGRLQAKVDALLDTLTMASPLIILVVGAHLVLAGEMTLGTMLALNALALGFLTPLTTLIKEAYDLQRLGSYLVRVNDVMDTPKEQQREEMIQPGKLSGEIALQDVSFSYSPLAPPVLRNINLNIEAGEFIGLVGASGSGKSTLAGLLMGLYKPSQGRILFDRIELQHMDLRAVRQQLGIVTQQSSLFPMSIRENIALSQPTAPLRKVVEAARQACIHDDIAAMPLGYQSILPDRGATLSGGQRQRLVLARALFQQPRILLLDEATSALDNMTEQAVYEELRHFNATRVVIAHRLSTIRHADRILVMDQGMIVESGSHDELLARDGHYARLVRANQSADEDPTPSAKSEGSPDDKP